MKNIKVYLVWLYSTLVFVFFGGMVSTILTQYPNYTHDLPNSLEIMNKFYAVANPGTFFELMGKIISPMFVFMIISIWKLKKTRNLYIIHFLLFLVIGIGTTILVYPILGEMTSDSFTSKSLDEIRQVLRDFRTLDSIRSVVALLSCLFLILGIDRFYKDNLSS